MYLQKKKMSLIVLEANIRVTAVMMLICMFQNVEYISN